MMIALFSGGYILLEDVVLDDLKSLAVAIKATGSCWIQKPGTKAKRGTAIVNDIVSSVSVPL
jgi:hypothetical protein